MFTLRKPTFANSSSKMMAVSKETGEKYTLNQISNIVSYEDGKEIYYEVIDVKTNFNDRKTEKKLGMLAYRGPKMSVYYVGETIHAGGSVGLSSTYGSSETYLKEPMTA